MKIFFLNGAKHLENLIGEKSEIDIRNFSDGEISIHLKESVRKKDVILVNSMRDSDSIIETCMAMDAIKRNDASNITALISYLPYMRQDRKDRSRSAIGAKVIVEMLEACGVDNFILLELHATQIEGFFSRPTTHIMGHSIFVHHLRKLIKGKDDYIICSPDVGGAKRAKKFSMALDIPLTIINKEREIANEVSSVELMGDVTGKRVILVDDLCDTGNSLAKSAGLLIEKGAIEVIACITHSVLSGNGKNVIADSKISKFYTTDSIYHDLNDGKYSKFNEKVELISCSDVINRVLFTINNKGSVDKELDKK